MNNKINKDLDKGVRYYKGIYKVRIISGSENTLYKGYRTVEALEEFCHDGLQMLIPISSQFSTSTRHLQRMKLK